MPSTKAPAYRRGKYNVKRKSPTTRCPICDRVVFSRGLNAHIKLGHPNQVEPSKPTIEAPEPPKLSEGGNATQLILRPQMLMTLAHYTREELQEFGRDLQDLRDKLEVLRTEQSTLFTHIDDVKNINRRRYQE